MTVIATKEKIEQLGPLHAVMNQTGPKTFWEAHDFNLQRFTRSFTPKNMKGQEDAIVPISASSLSSQAPSSQLSLISSCYDILNYAEFISISIQA